MLRQNINGESFNKQAKQIQKTSYQQVKRLSSGSSKVFTQQFLQNLKQQISQKVKPSKSILEALKHSNSQLQQYRKQIEILKKKNSELTQDKEQLITKINNEIIAKSVPQVNKKTKHQMKISITDFIHIENQRKSQNTIEIQIFKEKLAHFEQYKKLKESRYMQIIEREAKLVSQINMLNYKNQTLNSRVQSLEQLLASKQIQKRQNQNKKRKKREKVFDQNQQLNIYINYSDVDDKKYRNSLKVENISNTKRDSNLMVSCTKQIQIDSYYNIQKQAILQTQKFKFEENQQNEIDYLLEDLLPYTHTQSNISSDHSKQKVQQVEEKNNLGQSEIKIMI